MAEGTARSGNKGTAKWPPLVSVIIPAFNAESTIGEAVASALRGTYGPIEVIIVDDGSTDQTPAIAEEFARTDRRVRVHRRPNGGLSAALNSGFALANGDYVARLDADDIWHPLKLEHQVHIACQMPEAAFVYTLVRYVDGHGHVVRDGPRQLFPQYALCRGLYESLVGGGSSALMKRSAVKEACGCDEAFRSWEDLLLQLKISARHPIAFVPQYLVGYRISPGSLSQHVDDMLNTWLQLRERIKQLFPQIPNYVHDWAHGTRCVHFAESFAWRGRYLKCAKLLFSALRHDPRWTLRFLSYRIMRHLKLRLSQSVEAKQGLPFLDSSPEEQQHLQTSDSPAEGRALLRLHQERVRILAELDRKLALGVPARRGTCCRVNGDSASAP